MTIAGMQAVLTVMRATADRRARLEAVAAPARAPRAPSPKETHPMTSTTMTTPPPSAAARRAAADLGRLADLLVEAQALVPPLLTAQEAVARRAAAWKAAAVRAGRPWVTPEEE